MSSNHFFQQNIQKAINWLFEIQNRDNFGWAWVRDISPNIQNTCEVLYATSFYIDLLTNEQKEQYQLAVDTWFPAFKEMGADVAIEYIWLIMAAKRIIDIYDSFEYYDDEGNKHTFGVTKEQLSSYIKEVIVLIEEIKNSDNGIPENPGQISNTIRTSLLVAACHDIKNYLSKEDAEYIKKVDDLTRKATLFILDHQNKDGGFANVSENDISESFVKAMNKKKISGEVREEQYLSSDASTAYAVLALELYNRDHYHKQIKKGVNYLLENQHDDGSFDILFEVNMKEDYVYTFRHFGLAWSILALTNNHYVKVYDASLNKAIDYLVKLQDDTQGGFMSNPNSDCYTWATCNALVCFNHVEREFMDLAGDDFNSIIYEWWHNKNKPINKPKTINIIAGVVALLLSVTLNVYLICAVALSFPVEHSLIITLLIFIILLYSCSLVAYIIHRKKS